MSKVIKDIEHYLNFLEEFQAIPKEFQTIEQIESSEIYQKGSKIMDEIRSNFIDMILNKLKIHQFSFDYFVYDYARNFIFMKKRYDLFEFYNDRNLMKEYVKDIINFMLKLNKFTDQNHIEICEKINNDTPDVYDNIYNYIHILRNNDFFNNMFFSKLMNKSRYQSNVHLPYNLILISGEGHVVIIIKNNITKEIILFDPSYNISQSTKYSFLLDIFGHEYAKKLIAIDVQNVESFYQDIFCVYWCFHFIYFLFINNISPDMYQGMFAIADTHRYIYEIKAFILKILKETPIYEKYKDVYWKKYIKYKIKYVELKKSK